jgi:hypothetical protein
MWIVKVALDLRSRTGLINPRMQRRPRARPAPMRGSWRIQRKGPIYETGSTTGLIYPRMSSDCQGVEGRVSEARHAAVRTSPRPHLAFIAGTGTLVGKLVKRMVIEHTYRRDLPYPLAPPEIEFGTGSALLRLAPELHCMDWNDALVTPRRCCGSKVL